jgi:hypothetical protein
MLSYIILHEIVQARQQKSVMLIDCSQMHLCLHLVLRKLGLLNPSESFIMNED